MQPFTVKIFSGIFCEKWNPNNATLYRYDYTLRMIARQGCDYAGGLNPRLCGWVGVPCITDMSPKPNTDLHLFHLLSSEIHQC